MFSETSLRQGTFSWLTALSLAAASKLSYSAQSVVGDVATNDWQFSSADAFSNGDTQGFIAESDAVLLVAFRGTESLGDWLGNIDINRERRPYGSVHQGFYEAFEAVADKVTPAVSQASGAGKAVWLTGHSLGGALAAITALEMHENATVSGIYTFGQPRMVDRQARDVVRNHLASSFFRFVNDDDIVTRIPPNFHHPGNLLHFDHNGDVQQAFEESEAAATEAEPLSEAEFEAFQEEDHGDSGSRLAR